MRLTSSARPPNRRSQGTRATSPLPISIRMDTAAVTSGIDIYIDSSRSRLGADQTIRELDRIINYGQRASAANDNMASSAGRAGAGMRDAAKEGGALGKVLEDIRGRATGATPAVGGLINNLSGLGPMAAIAGGVALAVGAIGTAAIKAAAQTQAWNAQIETITKNNEKAKDTYAALVNFGNSTPFDTGQSVEAFVKLRQMGLAATEERLRSFGNTASASGKSLNQMIEAVADAGTGEFERLKEFGIKTKTEGQKVTFTMAGVKTTVENNSVAITKYLENIGNTKFGGAMAKQMDTLNGAFSNVEDSTRSMFSAIGEGKLGSAVKDIAKSIADGISLITPFMGSIGNAVGGIIQGVGSILNGLGSLWAGFGRTEGATNLMDGLTVALNLVGEGAQVLGSAVGSVFGFIGGLASSVGEMWRSSFGSLFGDLGNLFDVGTRSWSNSIVGILRAVKFVVGQMPNMFKVAVSDIMKMFRDMGSGILAFLTGDWKKGVELFNKPQFVSSQKAVGATWKGAQATYRDEKGADAAIQRLLGRTGKAKLDTGFDTTPDKAKDKDKKKGKSEAEKLAEKIEDFWKKVEGDSKDAKATYDALSAAAGAGANLATTSADTAKQLEFQRLAGRDITAQEKERISAALQAQRINKFLSDGLIQAEQRKYDLAEQSALLEAKRKGLTDSQLEVEKGVIEFRIDAQKSGVSLTDAAYQAAEAKLRVDLASAQAITDQNKALDDQKAKFKALVDAGKDVLAKYSGGGGLSKKLDEFKTERSQLDAWYLENKNGDNKEQVKRAYEDAVKGISRAASEATTEFKTRWIDALDVIAQNFSGKLGEAIGGIARVLQSIRTAGTDKDSSLFGGIASLFGGKTLAKYKDTSLDQAGSLAAALGNPLKSLSSGFGDFKKMFTDPGQGGFASVLGKGLAKAGQGAAIGSAVGGIGSLLGLGKGFSTGANIGGTLGGLFGPIGGIIGSLGGGLIGSLFSSAPKGKAVLTGAGQSAISGNKGSIRDALTGTAGSVQSGLAQIAQSLGGAVGAFNVSIGKYKDGFRVSSTGASNVDTKKSNRISGLIYNGKSEAEAIAIAIKDAISDGAITGIAPIIQKALQSLGTDSAIQFAQDWKAAMADYKSLTDPLGAAVDGIINPMNALRDTMVKLGAGTEDMAKLEDYRSKKLNAALKEQVSGFQDLLDQLNGDAGGFSDYAQLQTNLGKFKSFQADIAAGKSVDQNAFTALGNDILSKAGSSLGTNTKDYQDIVALLRGTTSGAISNATTAFNSAAGLNSAVVSAVQAQTDAYSAGQQTTNDLLAANNALLKQILASQGVGSVNELVVRNAKMVADW